MFSLFGRSVGVKNTEYEVADRGSKASRTTSSPDERNGDFANIGSARSLEV